MRRHVDFRAIFSGAAGIAAAALVSFAALASTTFLILPALHAQSQAAVPRAPGFDVVSIRPNDSGVRSWSESGLQDKVGRYRATNISLATLITDYHDLLNESQIVNAPRWLFTERYDIQAQVDGEPSRKDLIQMMRSLMEDRFQLSARRESRDTTVYTLSVPGKGLPLGAHLTTADDRDCPTGPTNVPGCRTMVPAPRGMNMEHVTFADLATALTSMLRQVVFDETGLKGRYDIKLEFDFTPPENGPAIPYSEILAGALQAQTGIRLQTQKRPLDVLVVDHVEMPSRN